MSNERAILKILKEIQKDLQEVRKNTRGPSWYNTPPTHDFYSLRKRKNFSHKLHGSLQDPEIRTIVLKLRREGQSYNNIAKHIREQWPSYPKKHPSRSAIHRFMRSARSGRLKEYGIDGMF